MFQQFVEDLIAHLKSYYTDLVDLTPKVILASVVFMICWFIAGRIRNFASRRFHERVHDPLLANFLSRLVRAILMIIVFFIILRIIGLEGMATSIAAGAGISAFVIGFALKDIGENFLAGILLAFKRPFTIGEIIESNGVKGTVVELNLRDTQVRASGKNIYIPNALLIKNVLTNYSHENFLSIDLPFTVDASADLDKANNLLLTILNATEGVLQGDGKDAKVQITALAGSAVTLTASYWIRTDAARGDSAIKSEIISKVLKSFAENDIPFPSNTVEIKQLPL